MSIDNNKMKKVLEQLNSWCTKHYPQVQSVYDDCAGYTLQQLVYYLLGVVRDTVNSWVGVSDQFNELYEFVHDYFDNLDVQEEINNKIDEMIKDGTFPTLIKNMLNYVCPEWYGATGDGVNDDTHAINMALNTNLTLKLQNNKKYKISSPLNIHSNQIIDGNGATVYLEVKDTDVYGVNTSELSNVTIKDVCFESNKQKNDDKFLIFIYMENCDNIAIKNCYFNNCSCAVGFYLSHDVWLSDNTVKNSFQFSLNRPTFAGVYGYGFSLNTCWNICINDNILGTSDAPIERHSIYVSKLITDNYYDYYNSNIVITNNIINQIQYNENILPLTGAEFCIKIISGMSVLINNNIINNGRGSILLSTLYQGCGSITIKNNLCVTYSYFIRCENESNNIYECVDISSNNVVLTGTYPSYITYSNIDVLRSVNNFINNKQTTLFYAFYEGEHNTSNYTANTLTYSYNDYFMNFVGIIRFHNIKKILYNSFTNLNNIVQNIIDGGDTTNVDITINNTPVIDFKKITYSSAGFKYFDPDFNSFITYDVNNKTLLDNSGMVVGSKNRPAVYPINKKFYDFNEGVIIYNTEIGFSENERTFGYFADAETLKTLKPTSYGYPIYNTSDKKPYWFDAYSSVWKNANGEELS